MENDAVAVDEGGTESGGKKTADYQGGKGRESRIHRWVGDEADMEKEHRKESDKEHQRGCSAKGEYGREGHRDGKEGPPEVLDAV